MVLFFRYGDVLFQFHATLQKVIEKRAKRRYVFFAYLLFALIVS